MPDLSMSLERIMKIVAQLKAENNPSNKEIIDFYEKKIPEVINRKWDKIWKKIKKVN